MLRWNKDSLYVTLHVDAMPVITTISSLKKNTCMQKINISI